MQDKHVYVVVLAGGSGTRLWPASRRAHPKQFCRIGSDKTLLEQTLLRLDGFVPDTQRLVVTQQEQYEHTAQIVQAGDAHKMVAEIIAEPEARGTLAAVGLATLALAARDPQAVVISLHADAFIADVPALQRTLAAAVQAARRDHIVLLGCQAKLLPRHATTTSSEGAPCPDLAGVHRARFHYRPDPQQAAAYAQRDDYFWNSGIFVWRAELFCQELQAKQPQLAQTFGGLRYRAGAILSVPRCTKTTDRWQCYLSMSFLAQSKCCVMLPVDCGWLDIGSWDALAQAFAPDKDGQSCPRCSVDA